jgi:hypothetical protein
VPQRPVWSTGDRVKQRGCSMATLPIVWDSTDYELDWPRELLRSELVALRHQPYRIGSSSEIQLLLNEAFHTRVPEVEYERFSSIGEWADDPGPGRQWVDDLLAHIDQLCPYAPPRPYWTARRAAPNGPMSTDSASPRQRFAELMMGLHTRGYLARDFAEPCVDGDDDAVTTHDLNTELHDRLGDSSDVALWPLQPDVWDTDTFYSLVEVFHDLVARPRHCWDHEYGDCGPHFESFDTDAGRRVYRSLVNRTLAECGVELRLADAGEDIGRLGHVVDEARGDLIARVTDTPESDVAGRIDHAIALFRRRDATAEDKRSAIVVLAGVLEYRERIIRQTPLLTRKDEDALFDIANSFALRHQNSKQQSDYDPVFLDWIFWWYLATVELTHRVLMRR